MTSTTSSGTNWLRNHVAESPKPSADVKLGRPIQANAAKNKNRLIQNPQFVLSIGWYVYLSFAFSRDQCALEVTEVGQTSLTCKLQKVCSVAETDASFDALIANAVGGLGKRMARWVGEKWIACELVDHVSKCLAG